MQFNVRKSSICGRISIPGSKSHTIRAIFISSLADGRSTVKNPLLSEDTMSAVKTCAMLGAGIKVVDGDFAVNGFSACPSTPENIIDVGNSGTTLRFAVSAAALGEGYSVFTGDEQIRRRPVGPLIDSINRLGGYAVSTRMNGCAPVVVKGKMTGGYTTLDSVTSQYLSSLLITTPLLEKDTCIEVTRLNEVPYVEMTLWWLDKQGIEYENENFKKIRIPGRQRYKPFNAVIPGDYSSATFFAVLAAISGGRIEMLNLDPQDVQGDRHVLDILGQMGAKVSWENGTVTIEGRKLKGISIDMNSIPDALPAMAVAGCFAEGETRLLNVPQARIKETDRISAMCAELAKMGADIEELEDGLIVRQSTLRGCRVNGRHDHRVVMALAIAGLNATGTTIIETAEAVNVTFPEFVKLAKDCGGKIDIENPAD